MMYDVVIIGAAAAGLTSAIYSARKGLKTLVLTKKVGGQSLLTDNIENFPGFLTITGFELIDKIRKQVDNLGVEFKEDIEIAGIEKTNAGFIVKARLCQKLSKPGFDIFKTKTIIIATGKKPRMLGVPGEREFIGKGVVFCSICDAPLFQGKDVVVVGGGNAGMEAARDLLEYADKIYVLESNGRIRGDESSQKRLRESGRVEFMLGVDILKIKGDKFVESLVYKDKKTAQEKELKVGGVFINIGQMPASGFLKGVVNLNKDGEVTIDYKTNQTSVPGIFAAGDVTDVKYKQCIIAAGEGAKAALSAYEYINKL